LEQYIYFPLGFLRFYFWTSKIIRI